jgi:hypothetical protein
LFNCKSTETETNRLTGKNPALQGEKTPAVAREKPYKQKLYAYKNLLKRSLSTWVK